MSLITPTPPTWDGLALIYQRDLASKGFDSKWFETDGKDDSIRLGVLNIYVKLRGLKIDSIPGWDFLQRQSWCAIGTFMFYTDSSTNMCKRLTADKNFASPGSGKGAWDSRELRGKLSIHFKHDKAWEKGENGANVVGVHIDPVGLVNKPGFWPKLNFVHAIEHQAHYYDYQKVVEIRDSLLQEGWDQGPLVGS